MTGRELAVGRGRGRGWGVGGVRGGSTKPEEYSMGGEEGAGSLVGRPEDKQGKKTCDRGLVPKDG